MKRSEIQRKTPLRARSNLKPGGRLRQQSAKRQAEHDLRADVRHWVITRDGGCRGATMWPEIECGGPLDVDEWEARSAHPGAHLDPSLCQALCRRHHEQRHAQPIEAARRGLRPYPLNYIGPEDTTNRGMPPPPR